MRNIFTPGNIEYTECSSPHCSNWKLWNPQRTRVYLNSVCVAHTNQVEIFDEQLRRKVYWDVHPIGQSHFYDEELEGLMVKLQKRFGEPDKPFERTFTKYTYLKDEHEQKYGNFGGFTDRVTVYVNGFHAFELRQINGVYVVGPVPIMLKLRDGTEIQMNVEAETVEDIIDQVKDHLWT